MSALDDLKDRIDSAIYTNTEQNITGDGLQTVLDDMVDTMGVSVSQNTETGHTNINIGSDTIQIPSLDDLDRLCYVRHNITQSQPIALDKVVIGNVGSAFSFVTTDLCNATTITKKDNIYISGVFPDLTRHLTFVNSSQRVTRTVKFTVGVQTTEKVTFATDEVVVYVNAEDGLIVYQYSPVSDDVENLNEIVSTNELNGTILAGTIVTASGISTSVTGFSSAEYDVSDIHSLLRCISPTSYNGYIYTYALLDDNNNVLFRGPTTNVEHDSLCNLLLYPNATKLWIAYNDNDGVASCLYTNLKERTENLEDTLYEIPSAVSELEQKVRDKVIITPSDTEQQIYDKMYNAFIEGNKDVIWQTGVYNLSEIYTYMASLGVTIYEIPVGNNCRYFFTNSVISVSAPTGWTHGFNIFGCRRSVQNFELYDGILINNGGTYCVHDEAEAKDGDYRHYYKNVRMKYISAGSTEYLSKCIGGGTGLKGTVIIEDCIFETDNYAATGPKNWYPVQWHGNLLDSNPIVFNLTIVNCYFIGGSLATQGMLREQDKMYLTFSGNSYDIAPFFGDDIVVNEWNNTLRN